MELQTLYALNIIKVLHKVSKNMNPPMIHIIIRDYGRDPFLILIGCLLSLRSRDKITFLVCQKLFALAKTPEEFTKIPILDLEKIIYPIGFYKKKARLLQDVSTEIIVNFHGMVPADEKSLLSIKGVGRKTANLVLAEAFNIPAICVDTHVHKISNKMGLINTKTPYESELSLQNILPKKNWSEWNKLLVMWGQNSRIISPIIEQYFPLKMNSNFEF